MARNADRLDITLYVSPTPDATNIVVATHLIKATGEVSGADDLGVMTTGARLVEIQKDGQRLGILVQLHDAGHQTIGAVVMMYAYKPGDDVEAAVRKSFALRDALTKRIASRAALIG